MIVGLIGPGGEGGTFLDWTLHYLSGDTHANYVLVNRLTKTFEVVFKQEIVSNPIRANGTAHNHRKSHPTEQLIQVCMDQYELIDDNEVTLKSMYIVPSIESYCGLRSYKDVVSDIAYRYKQLKLIHFIYPENIMNLVKRMTKIQGHNETFDDIRNRVNAESIKDDKVVNQPIVYPLNIDDMFYNLDSEIRNICDWLSFTINEERYNSWIDIYKQWQLVQNFCTTIKN